MSVDSVSGTLVVVFERVPPRSYFDVRLRDYLHLAGCVGKSTVMRFDARGKHVAVDMSRVVAVEFVRDGT